MVSKVNQSVEVGQVSLTRMSGESFGIDPSRITGIRRYPFNPGTVIKFDIGGIIVMESILQVRSMLMSWSSVQQLSLSFMELEGA